MPKSTYVDACLLMAAFKGKGDIGLRAMEILDDPDRVLVVSDAVWLEVMPKPRYQKQVEEATFYEEVFQQAEKLNWDIGALYDAHKLAESHGIAAMDAIHVAAALNAKVDEFATAEKSSKPMFRVRGIKMHSIRNGIA